MEFWNHSRRFVGLGLLAGLLGGAVGTAAKTAGEWVYPPRTQGQMPPPEVLAEKVAGHPLEPSKRHFYSELFHWTTGSGMGALYGGVAEFVPMVTVGYGAAFGIAVLLGTHESALPLLGLNKPPLEQPRREQESEFVTHIIYGVGTEVVRRWLMARWRRKQA